MARGALTTKRIQEKRRIAKAVELAAEGTDFREIANQLGYKDDQIARQAVRRALEATMAQSTGFYREMQLTRMQRAIRALMPQVDDGDLKAIDVLIKVEERIARLMGLDGNMAADPENQEARRKKSVNFPTAEEDAAKILKVLAESGGFAELMADGTPLAALFLPDGVGGDDDDIPEVSEGPEVIEALAAGFSVHISEGVDMMPPHNDRGLPQRGW